MSKKILIVDDERDIVETLAFMLKQKGYECIAAYDGEEGLKLAKEEAPDLIILDVMMPKINGYKICRLLKFDTKYKEIPIKFLKLYNLYFNSLKSSIVFILLNS